MAPLSRPGSALPRAGLSQSASAGALGSKGSCVWASRSGRPTSAVPGWPGAASAVGAPGGQRMYRPGSAVPLGRSKQAPFSASFTEGSGTRSMKDWRVAGDLAQRSQRRDVLQLRRQSASLGQLLEPSAMDLDTMAPDFSCPLARGPLGETLRPEVRPKSATWHKKKVKQMYKLFDPQQDGAVRLDQLRQSFQVMSVPINDHTFERYAQDHLLSDTSDPNSTVFKEDFINFHKDVWANQPGFVRWHAGDPAECASTPAAPPPNVLNAAAGVADAMLLNSTSAPCIVSASELRNNEVMLRKSFTRHADGRSALLASDKIPAILQDLGLPGDLQDILATEDMDASTIDVTDELTFHQTVTIVNKCILTHEASRAANPASLAANKVGQRLEAALQFSSELADEDEVSSDDDDVDLKRRASVALEAALFGEPEPPQSQDLNAKAKGALEAALGDSDSDKVDLVSKAQNALELALAGDSEEDEDQEDQRIRRMSAHALEAALFGEAGEPPDDPDYMTEQEEVAFRRKSADALEAALFGDGFAEIQRQAEEAEEAREDKALRRKSAQALEAALFGITGDLAGAEPDDPAESEDECDD